MSETPINLKYLDSHEWALLGDDGIVTVGITDYAQDSLGDVVYVELPEMGAEVKHKEEAGVVESVKAASDIFAPVSGEVVAINSALEDDPEIINNSPYEDGWFFKIRATDTAELESLLDADGYDAVCEAE